MTKRFTENGISVEFQDANYFQFSTCPAYLLLKAHSVKEMDICWLDIATNVLWVIELKAFDNPDNALFLQSDLRDGNIVNYWIDELYKKSVHTLCMIETNRSNTQTCLNNNITSQTTIRLVHLINVLPGQETHLSFMQDELRKRLKPFISIFGVQSFSVIPYSLAKGGKLLPWIV